MKDKKIVILFGAMLVSLCFAYIKDMPEYPGKKSNLSYNPTNFTSTKEMFDKHHEAYEELVKCFMEKQIEAAIVYDNEGNLIKLEFIQSSEYKEIDNIYYEKIGVFLKYLKEHHLLTNANPSAIRFMYESPADDWGEHYREFYKTKEKRYRAHFILSNINDGVVGLELLYENIDDRINGQEYSGTVERLRPNWFHVKAIRSCSR